MGDKSLPTICEFFGIVIRMYCDDHNPPHFHAYYGSEQAIFGIETLELLEGSISRRGKAMIVEWASENRAALMADWKLAEAHMPLEHIEPLE